MNSGKLKFFNKIPILWMTEEISHKVSIVLF